MRLRQIWNGKYLTGLKLDTGYGQFIKLDAQLVKLFIDHINAQANPKNNPF